MWLPRWMKTSSNTSSSNPRLPWKDSSYNPGGKKNTKKPPTTPTKPPQTFWKVWESSCWSWLGRLDTQLHLFRKRQIQAALPERRGIFSAPLLLWAAAHVVFCRQGHRGDRWHLLVAPFCLWWCLPNAVFTSGTPALGWVRTQRGEGAVVATVILQNVG